MPPYHDLYGEVYQRGFNNAAKVQDQIEKQAQLAEQIRQHRANEIIQSARYMQAAQDHAAKTQAGDLNDAQANYTANTAVPPSAFAVGDEAPMANSARTDYFAAHPSERPGPLLPYMGGHTGLATYLSANKAPGTAGHNIDPNSPEGIAARLDYFTKQQAIKPPVPRNLDPNSEEGRKARLQYETDLLKIKPHNIDRLSPEGQAAENSLFDYRQAHTVHQPGPWSPEVIDAREKAQLQHQRNLREEGLSPYMPKSSGSGDGPVKTAEAAVQGILGAHFQGYPQQEVMGPNTRWDFLDINDNVLNFDPAKTPLVGDGRNGEPEKVQATVPGRAPVRAPIKAYLDLNKSWAKLQERKAGAGASQYLPPKSGAPVTTKAQYDALPSGAEFPGADGKKYRKP